MVMFITLELAVPHPLLDLRLFLIRNFTLSIVLAVFRSVGLFGSVFLFPIFLQTLMGYTPVHAGFWMIPNAIAVGVTMPFAGRLADRHSPALLTGVGAAMVGISLVWFGRLDPLSGWAVLVLPQLARGAGLALMMAPLMAAALNSVPHHELPMASSFLNVSQNVGGSLGIASLNTFVTNSIHIHAARLGEVFPVQSPGFFRLALDVLPLEFHGSHGILATPQLKVAFAAAKGILRRAQVMGFENGFVLAGLVVLSGIPLCLLLKPSAHHVRPEEKEKPAAAADYVID
jgi:DHA2 family multidrug resistance protein